MSDPNFYAYLQGNSQVTTLVAQRIYPVRAPQGAPRPLLVWMRQGIQRQQTYCGANAVVRAEYQFSCYGGTPDQARDVHLSVRNAMQDFVGFMGAVSVKHCHLDNDFATEDEDPDIYTVRQLWTVQYVET